MHTLESKARDFAILVHEEANHKRKYNGEPYYYHMGRVVLILKEVTRDQDILAAAWLHDCIEDIGISIFKLKELFGNKVASLVLEMTNLDHVLDYKHLNRKVRKEINNKQWARSSSDAQTIKYADLIDNTEDIAKHDKNFAITYVNEVEELLTVMNEGNNVLRTKLLIQISCLREELKLK